MFKKDKKLFITILLMFIIVVSLIFITFLYEGRNQSYKDLIEAKNKSYGELQKENKKLIEDINILKDENEILKNKMGNFNNDADLSVYIQSLNDLSDISLMIKEGNIKNAKAELLKIDPSGFDPTSLAFYESLCRELNIIKEN